MAITVKHKFVSAIPDAGDTTIVQPSNWNDSHDLVGTVPPANGGTGASTLTGYVKGNGTATMTASATIPNTDISGLGTMSTQNANAIAVTGGTMSGVSITGYIPTTEKAVANGVATLDGSGTVPVSQLPAAVLGALSYQGTWNASTNTPTLTSSVGTKGYYYVVNVAGSTNLNGITDWQIGDWAVYNGSAWQKIDNTDAVTSVNGYTGTVVLGYGDITTGVVPVVNGGTGVTVSSGANSVVLRDANVNINANALDDGYSNIAASGTPIVLTTASVRRFTITGSGGQTIKLPDATTLTSGAIFQFDNNQSSGAITVNNNSNTLIVSVPSGGFVLVNLLSNATAAGSWDRHDQAPSNVSWSTNTFDYAGSFTSGTWNGNAVAYNRGGTGQSSAFTAGGIVYGSTTSALAVTPIGTTGQVLTSAGAGTPTWTTPTTGTVTSVTGTSPVVSSGGTTPAISMPVATTSVSGYLSSTDWNTFNGKGSGSVTSVALTAPSIFTVTGSPVTSSGTLALTYSGTALPILNGGTGQTTANSAFNALAPSQTSNSGKYLTTNGTDTSWATLGSTYSRTSFTATTAQTTFTVSYTVGLIQVYVNGVFLNGADYTATNGTSIVLAVACNAGDIVEALAFSSFSVASTVSSFSGGTTGLTPSTGTTGNVTLGGTLAVANGGTGVTTSTGSGNLVLSTSPTLVTPILGTPTSGTLTNATGLPLTTGVTGTLAVANGGTGVTTNTGSGAVVLGTSPTITTAILSSPTINTPTMGGSVITSGTSQASTSGTAINFTSIPSWVKRITVIFNEVSTNGSSAKLIQIGSGSVTSTGYVSTSIDIANSSATGGSSSTAGFLIYSNNAVDLVSGHIVLTLISGNLWISSHTLKQSATQIISGAGSVSLSGALDRLRVTTVNGTDTFDAGSINILYE